MPALGKILIIDDNEDVLFALHLLLEPYAEKVKVMRSPDRIVHFITDFRPDIVLLDMNFTRDTVSGQEGMDCLQEILKLDRHAVVVMMTAYADTDKAVQAIKAGATDFVSKPWENDKLLATLHAAMKLRRSQTEVGRLEERVEALSADMGLERSSLYRKMQAIAGQTPTEFMRSIRLKRAARLLESGQYSVQEISWMVGFNTPRYFSSYFKEMFGMTPSAYAAQNRKQPSSKA